MDTTGAQPCSPCLLSNVWDPRNCAVSRLRMRTSRTAPGRHAPYVPGAPRLFKVFCIVISIFYVILLQKILRKFIFLALIPALMLRYPNVVRCALTNQLEICIHVSCFIVPASDALQR